MSEPPLDRLFGAPLDEFVRVRDELARSLRKEGKEEQAAEVAALRKPTVPVWAVNQLARRRRRDVDLLLDAGHRLRGAQAEPDPDRARAAFAQAGDAEREALKRLRAAAGELLEAERGRPSSALVDRAMATLRAAAVTEEGRELLARGRLTQELGPTGFEVAAALVPSGRSTRRAGAGASRQDELEPARAELGRARERQREASRRLREAERDAARARREAAAADEELGHARRQADEAAAAVAAAEEALRRARRRT